MRVHKATFAALALAASLSLTACQGGDSASSSASAGSSASGSSTADDSTTAGSTTGSGTAGSANGGSATGGSGSGGSGGGSAQDSAGKSVTGSGGSGESTKSTRCRTSGLTITAVDSTIDGDRDASVTVTLKNSGSATCTVSGYAGVDLKTNAGTISAKRTGQAPASATLKPGQETYFGVNYPFNNTGGTGVRITGLLVTPPNETKTVTLAWPGKPSLPITEDGSGTKVTVGPIGSAGQGG